MPESPEQKGEHELRRGAANNSMALWHELTALSGAHTGRELLARPLCAGITRTLRPRWRGARLSTGSRSALCYRCCIKLIGPLLHCLCRDRLTLVCAQAPRVCSPPSGQPLTAKEGRVVAV